MHIRCPHCHNPIEVVNDDPSGDISCPSCGSCFNLAKDAETAQDDGTHGKLLGHFQLLNCLGQGAFGAVWKARDTELDRIVALKIPRKENLTEADAEKFLREARAAAQVRHPNIVSVHEVGREDGSIYIASDFIDGASLDEWIEAHPLTVRESVELCAKIAEALHHAHEAGVVHRDLKPQNILVKVDGGGSMVDGKTAPDHQPSTINLQPFITDFGLAKRDAGEITMTVEGAILGTPAYMPPEQARGEAHHADRRSDVYSLGVILFRLLTGELPFRGQRQMLIVQILSEEPPALRKLDARLPRDVETICLKCLEKDPARRYQSAAALAADLRRWLTGHPIQARPVSRTERAWRWCRRNPAVASLSATVALVLLMLVAGSVLFAVQQQEAAKQLAAKNRQLDRSNTQLAQANTDLEESNASERAAKQDADQKRIDAETARNETKAALEFFQTKVLAAARPKDQEGGLGIDISIRAALDAAEPMIAESFTDQPLVEAAIRYTLGTTHWYLGEAELAILQHERARALRESKLGPEHPDTLASINNLALAYIDAGRLDQALSLFEQTLELRKANLGPEHFDTLESMHNLATAYARAGKLDQALPLHEQTLELMKAKLGPEHPRTLTAMNNLATAYGLAGRRAEALQLHEQTLDLRKATLGPEHPETSTAMYNLAAAYQSAGKLDQALPLFEQTLEVMKANFGADHSRTLMTMGMLAKAYRDSGRLGEALPLIEQSLELKKAKFGHDHLDTLRSMHDLANAYRSLGRVTEASLLLEQTLDLMKAKVGPDHRDTHGLMGSLALTYLIDHHSEKALPLFDQLIAGQRARPTRTDSNFAELLGNVSRDLLNHRQYPAAETYLRECLTIAEKNWSDHWSHFYTKSMLGGALAGQKKFQEAEPLLVEGYSGMKAREAMIPPTAKTRLPEAIQRLVDLYVAWEKPEQAAEWQKQLDQAQATLKDTEAKPSKQPPK